jgi:hypothetical protein
MKEKWLYYSIADNIMLVTNILAHAHPISSLGKARS